VKVVALEDARDSLSDYARKNRRNAVIVTRRGKPVSALVPLEPGADLERLALAASSRFRAILARSRAELGEGKAVSSDDMRRVFGLKRKAG
jgi:antitoxin (DNA-binding transcriptional repressor) of toxin-antitoxin stability system